MSKYRFIICFVVVAVVVASCSEQNSSMIDQSEAEGIAFVSGLNKYDTRLSVDGSRWTVGDQVGIYMMESGKSIETDYSNVPYEAESSAQTTTFKAVGTSLYYPVDGSAVDFVAYYPYTSGITDMVYPIDLANQSVSLTAHDLLYAKADNSGQGYTNSSVSFGFTHPLSKMKLNLVDENNQSISPDANGVIIKGMNTTAHFDLKTATFNNEAAPADITPYHHSNSFEAILLPFTIGAEHEVTIVVNDKQYKWTMNTSHPAHEIKSGYSYTFKITVKTSSAEVDAVLVEYDGSSIGPWGDGGADNQTQEATENFEIPADFEKITLATGESIKSALSAATGPKVAIVLANGGSYSESSGLSVPASVTSLMIVGEGGITTPSVYFASSLTVSGNMDLIQLYNIDLSGVFGASYFINQETAVTIGAISIESCKIHDIRGIIRLRTNASTINSYKINNSIIYNINTYQLLAVEAESTVSFIELTQSTLYNLAGRGFNLNAASTTVVPTVTIDQCTFNTGPYYAIVQFQATAGGMLTFTNNIIGLPYNTARGVSVVSGGTMNQASNNYYVSDTTWQGSAVGDDCGFTADQLFTDPTNGDYTQSALAAGDPRWY